MLHVLHFFLQASSSGPPDEILIIFASLAGQIILVLFYLLQTHMLISETEQHLSKTLEKIPLWLCPNMRHTMRFWAHPPMLGRALLPNGAAGCVLGYGGWEHK